MSEERDMERQIFLSSDASNFEKEVTLTEKQLADLVHVAFLLGIGTFRHFINNRDVFDTFEKWDEYKDHQLEILTADLLKKQLL